MSQFIFTHKGRVTVIEGEEKAINVIDLDAMANAKHQAGELEGYSPWRVYQLSVNGAGRPVISRRLRVNRRTETQTVEIVELEEA